jgi:hypothetical protein
MSTVITLLMSRKTPAMIAAVIVSLIAARTTMAVCVTAEGIHT